MNKKNNNNGLISSVKGYTLPTIATPILIIFEVVMEVFIPLVMAAIVDGGLYREEEFVLKSFFSGELIADKTRFVIVLGVIMITSAILSLIFGVAAGRTAAIASAGYAKNLRATVFRKIQSFSFRNIDKFSIPSLVMRLTTDITNIQDTFHILIRLMIRSPIMMIFSTIMAFQVDAQLSLIFVVAIPLLALSMGLLIKIGYPRFSKMLKKYDALNAGVQENLVNIRVVKSFAREEYEKEKFNKSAEELKRIQIKAEKMFSFANPIQLAIMWICTILVLYFGAEKIIFFKTIKAGELVTLISYTTQIVSSLSMLSFLFIMIAMCRASYKRIVEVFNEEIDIKDGKSGLTVVNGDICFENVDFSYTYNKEKLNLRNVNLEIKSGETIGIIGGTGEGKSSLVQLIPRFYDCLSGSVKVGGINVKEYSVKELRDSVGFVLQNNVLFSGTIKDNLKWGNANATDEEIKEACKTAAAHDFIESFPDGYETVLGQGGVNVSGGQKQRLCIARALLKKPKILIFDDSTSAVDTATDEKIRKSMKDYLKETTKIIIAQRINSVINADRIIVLSEGEISAVGTHEELLKTSEIYKEVCASQLRGEENA